MFWSEIDGPSIEPCCEELQHRLIVADREFYFAVLFDIRTVELNTVAFSCLNLTRMD